jgi:cysteine dioxygenase
MVDIQQFVRRLTSIEEENFTHSRLLEFVGANPVEIGSLSEYLYFSLEHYTRNLIHQTELFELIAICWEIGQKSPIHNHRDQNCWMAVPYGKLQIHNFHLIKKEPSTSFCELKSSGQFLMDPQTPQAVDPTEPIHQVLNLPSFGSKAVSLHIYSKPYDSCEVYDLKEKRYQDVPLINTSEYGVLKAKDYKVEKFAL